ncbi:hypothetical protein TNIN_86871 [Trichonephila inaurata madagascariensis]|uniref:Uncharacterized protein n=1 Tax=Trichonephila inaurata madagascariensis TaxID=2747483 RepID=A0A8X7BSK7_9ARAC|nr:hypothetical protein TNIN_86871 [Trichonephila inaurata madagascariensis]
MMFWIVVFAAFVVLGENIGTNALDVSSVLCHEPICLPLCIIHKPHPLACPSCYCPMPSFPPFRFRFPPPPPPPPPPSILPLRPKELARPQFRPHILSPQIPFPPLPPLPPGVPPPALPPPPHSNLTHRPKEPAQQQFPTHILLPHILFPSQLVHPRGGFLVPLPRLVDFVYEN